MIGTDYHIHTAYVGCAVQAMTIPAILERSRKTGRKVIAITDHRDDDARRDKNQFIRAELERTDPGGLTVYFGCELNIQSLDADVVLDEAMKRAEGFEFIIAGVHNTWYKPGEATVAQIIERHNELLCKIAAHPLVDVVAHPWWFPGSQYSTELMGKFNSMAMVPDELTCRLAEACIAHDKPVEMNTSAVFTYGLTPDEYKASYQPYLARLVELGVKISLASDAHSMEQLDGIVKGEKLLAEIGIPDSQVWHPRAAARVTGSALR